MGAILLLVVTHHRYDFEYNDTTGAFSPYPARCLIEVKAGSLRAEAVEFFLSENELQRIKLSVSRASSYPLQPGVLPVILYVVLVCFVSQQGLVVLDF